jgi:hypothetical protein
MIADLSASEITYFSDSEQIRGPVSKARLSVLSSVLTDLRSSMLGHDAAVV